MFERLCLRFAIRKYILNVKPTRRRSVYRSRPTLKTEELDPRYLLTGMCDGLDTAMQEPSDVYGGDAYGGGELNCSQTNNANGSSYGAEDVYCGSDAYGGGMCDEYGGTASAGTVDEQRILSFSAALQGTSTTDESMQEWFLVVELSETDGCSVQFSGAIEGFEIQLIQTEGGFLTYSVLLPIDFEGEVTAELWSDSDGVIIDSAVTHF